MLLTLALALNFIAVEQERGAPSEGFAAALNRNRWLYLPLVASGPALILLHDLLLPDRVFPWTFAIISGGLLIASVFRWVLSRRRRAYPPGLTSY